jgi:hypothetical protein
MPSPYNPTWGSAIMLTHDTNLPLHLSSTGHYDVCTLLFDDARCEMLPTDPRLQRHWLFTLHQKVQATTGTPTSVLNDLRFFVAKPADAEVTIQLRANGLQQQAYYGQGQEFNDTDFMQLRVPASWSNQGYDVRFDVQVRRLNATEQVLVSIDSLDMLLE